MNSTKTLLPASPRRPARRPLIGAFFTGAVALGLTSWIGDPLDSFRWPVFAFFFIVLFAAYWRLAPLFWVLASVVGGRLSLEMLAEEVLSEGWHVKEGLHRAVLFGRYRGFEIRCQRLSGKRSGVEGNLVLALRCPVREPFQVTAHDEVLEYPDALKEIVENPRFEAFFAMQGFRLSASALYHLPIGLLNHHGLVLVLSSRTKADQHPARFVKVADALVRLVETGAV
jgi:hypothetical protein